MTTTNSIHPRATTVKKLFSRETSVNCEINSEPSIVWALLTNSSDYPRWNSTVLSIEGTIAPGETIKLKSVLDPKRLFKLKVKKFESQNCLVWGDGMGNRIFKLTPQNDGRVVFSMTEKMGGPLFPLFVKMIPPFDEVFNQFANDLKKEAEKIMNSK